LWCWGGSWSGELGTGERLRLAHYLTPQRVALPEPITDVAVGSQHTCALGASGGVFCAGDNLTGQVPGASDQKVLRFRAISIDVRLTSIVAQADETCGITATGAVRCWGGFSIRGAATFAPPSGARYTTVAVGGSHRCAVSDRAQLFCWGSISGSNGSTPSTPTLITTPAPVRVVSAASSDICILDVIGATYCWPPGARRDVTAEQRIADVPIATAISAHGATRCVLSQDGRAWCWGFDLFGALGRGGSYDGNQSTSDLTFPVPQPVSTPHRFVQLTGNGGAFCGLTSLGRAYCWGNNRNGVLGDGVRRRTFASITTAFSPVPVPVR
jgi:alpha-tubulin suppressor-like RCC1 family protein